MFAIKLLHFIKGYVCFEGYSQNPHIFINSCLKTGLNLWNLKCDKDYICACVSVSHYKFLRDIVRKSNTNLKIKSRHGLPFYLQILKKRKGITVGIILFFLIINFLSHFIWNVDIKIDGNVETDIAAIETSLNELGVKNGAYMKDIDVQMAEKELMLKQDDVAWVSINLTGSVAEVEISIKTEPPKSQTDTTPCNLVASEPGQIVKSEVIAGQKEFTLLEPVEKGQILVNGIVQNEEGEILHKHSAGKVFALVRKNIDIETAMKDIEINLKDENISKKKLDIFNIVFPLTVRPSPKGNYESTIAKHSLILLGRKLPISITNEVFVKKEEKILELDKAQAQKKVRNLLEEKINSEKDTKIISSEENFEYLDNKIILHANVLLEKNIALESPLAVEIP